MRNRVWMLLFLLVLLFPLLALADSVYIPDRSVSIYVPDNFIPFERHDENMDSRLISQGLSKMELQSYMNQSGVNLYLYSSDFSVDINVIIVDAQSINNLSFLDDDILMTLFDKYDEYAEYGAVVDKRDIKREEGNAYIRIWARDSTTERAVLQYITIVDYQALTFTLTSYLRPITEDDEKLLDKVVLNSQLSKHDSGLGSKDIVLSNDIPEEEYYQDDVTGICFTIPSGWKEQPLNVKREIMKMKMEPDVDVMGVSISYGYQDLWEALSFSYKYSNHMYYRSDVDSLASAAFFAEQLGAKESEIVTKEYAGIRFFESTTIQSADDISIPMFYAATIHNGYMIMFILVDLPGDFDNAFEDVLSSIKFIK